MECGRFERHELRAEHEHRDQAALQLKTRLRRLSCLIYIRQSTGSCCARLETILRSPARPTQSCGEEIACRKLTTTIRDIINEEPYVRKITDEILQGSPRAERPPRPTSDTAAVPDPPTASMALDGPFARRSSPLPPKLQCKEDLQTEAVVGLFRRSWQAQRQAASFAMTSIGCMVRNWSAFTWSGLRLHVRQRSSNSPSARRTRRRSHPKQFDILDEDRIIIAINTALTAPSVLTRCTGLS